ncbi:hypothetical protein DSUL_50200 [Desulfovibrionales bacterium]
MLVNCILEEGVAYTKFTVHTLAGVLV